MAHTTTTTVSGNHRSRDLAEGVAATLRRLEREASAATNSSAPADGASRRLDTFQRSLARALQRAHLESVQEMAGG